MRVDRDAADREEASRLAAAVADGADRRERDAIENDDLLVVAVGDEQIALLRVVRERDVPHRAERRHGAELAGTTARRLLRDEGFLHELAVLLEHLDAVVRAVADVDHAVLRDLDAGDVAELPRRRRVRIVGAGIRAGFSP